MKILQICNKPPFPPVDGGCIAMNSITDGLLKCGHQVKVLAIATQKHPFLEQNIPKEYKDKTQVEACFIDTRIKIGPAFANLFTNKSYNVDRFVSEEFRQKLIDVLKKEKYDVVHLESLFVAPYIDTIRKHSQARIVIRAHNVEYEIWDLQAAAAKFFLKKAYLKILAKRIKAYEAKAVNQADGIAAITQTDKNGLIELGCTKPIEVFPVGVDSSKYQPAQKRPEPLSIFHLGSMDWSPNVEGITWFIEKVWPSASANFPDLKLYLAGRKMPGWLLDIKLNNVIISDDVPSALDFINSKNIMIVPLLSGSGMRVKIIEGMALGKTIISTRFGAEGVDCTDGENILLADEPQEFVMKLTKCLNDPKYSKTIGDNARKLIKEKYDNKQICTNLGYFYRELISSN